MTPIPTMYLRFVEREEIVEQHDTYAVSRTVNILQQFWEHSNGKEMCGDVFNTVLGDWRDVPKVKK